MTIINNLECSITELKRLGTTRSDEGAILRATSTAEEAMEAAVKRLKVLEADSPCDECPGYGGPAGDGTGRELRMALTQALTGDPEAPPMGRTDIVRRVEALTRADYDRRQDLTIALKIESDLPLEWSVIEGHIEDLRMQMADAGDRGGRVCELLGLEESSTMDDAVEAIEALLEDRGARECFEAVS